MTNSALLSTFWRLVILTLLLILLSPAFIHGQRPGAVRLPPLGFYFGLLSEQSRFDGARANAREEESGQIGLYVGRWSVGSVSKTIGRSYRLATVGSTFSAAMLEAEGVELGRVFRTHSMVQPTAHLMVGRAAVERRTFVNGMMPGITSTDRTPIVELSGGIGVPVWRVVRFEARAGVRLGGTVAFESARYSTTAWFLQARSSAGWLGDWRKH